ncbi:MAG TPA: carboxy-S-adenosyl-L-methionine synthase CmoA [Bacteroidales bacterium]|nr:carboxy-S-adenosyl-L-methionine synthase CmoA [Bacteroidales bacterium]
MNTDQIFKARIEKSSDFKFDSSVVNVFDDMVVRSVPMYLEIQRMITEIACDYAKAGTSLYDLGCSTGTTLISLNTVLDPSVKFVGIDDSDEMLESCRKNFEERNITRSYELLNNDLNRQFSISNASVVVLCLTLQFIRPINRHKLLRSLREQINPGGCLIIVEKVLCENTEFNRRFIKYYYDLKRRNNYDDMEIAQKREALENVLIPYKITENQQLITEAGFTSCETFFKWYNFSGIVAVK